MLNICHLCLEAIREDGLNADDLQFATESDLGWLGALVSDHRCQARDIPTTDCRCGCRLGGERARPSEVKRDEKTRIRVAPKFSRNRRPQPPT